MIGLLSAILLVPMCVEGAPPDAGSQDAADQIQLSLPELAALLIDPNVDHYFSSWHPKSQHFEAVLQQIIAHGGPGAEAIISERLKLRPAELESAQKLGEQLDREGNRDALIRQNGVIAHLQRNVELVAALRRLQNKPDPVQVDVLLAIDGEEPQFWLHLKALRQSFENGSSTSFEMIERKRQAALKNLEAATGRLEKMCAAGAPSAWKEQNSIVKRWQELVNRLSWDAKVMRDVEKVIPRTSKMSTQSTVKARAGRLPTVVVTLRSADVERVPLWLKRGGDGRSGREARWRFEVKDSRGNILPARKWDSFVGGGIYSENLEGPAEFWQTALPMSRYIGSLEPGEYSVSMLYHNEVTIADIEDPGDLKRLIIFRSKPFKLTVVSGSGD